MLTVALIFGLTIAFTVSPSGNVDSLYPEFTAYKEQKKSLYVWSHATTNRLDDTPAWILLVKNKSGEIEKLADFCSLHGFNNVIFFAGSVEWEYEDYYSKGVLPYEDDYIYNIQYLASKGISTDLMVYLNDDPNNMTDYQHIDAVARIAQRLRDEGVPLNTLHIDQEPSKQNRYADLLRMLSIASQYIDVGVSLKPQWVREKLSSITAQFKVESVMDEISALQGYTPTEDSTFSDLILMIAPKSVVMAYSNSTETSIRIGKQAVDSLCRAFPNEDNPRVIEFAVETGFVNDLDEAETLHYWIKKNKPLWFNKIRCLSNSLLGYAKRNGVEGGLVIHDYAQYYSTLYCVSPALDVKEQTRPYEICSDEAERGIIMSVLNGC